MPSTPSSASTTSSPFIRRRAKQISCRIVGESSTTRARNAKLTVQGSDVLDDLKKLESKGVQILVCGTCLNYFEIKDKLAVGIVSNMYDIVEIMSSAGRLFTP